ncbi:MAG: diguanylate cyclase [Gammaproteobacteria bacterium]|nr:diguanylate cyclase [Gammaproteobacteria bacterium]
MATDDPGAEQWKQKYYDQLDRLDQKEKEWGSLESVLKRAIGRLSLAAEGNHQSLDRHIRDIRAAVKDKINQHRLESILEDLSRLLAKIEEKQSSPDKQSISLLLSLLEKLDLPQTFNKPKNKLIKRLSKATDKETDSLLKETISLLASVITVSDKDTEARPGLFERILGSSDSSKNTDVQMLATTIVHIIKMLPWPDSLSADIKKLINNTEQSNTDQDISNNIAHMEQLVSKWEPMEVSSAEFVSDQKIISVDEFIKKLNKKINWPENIRKKIVDFESRLTMSPEIVEALIVDYALLIDGLKKIEKAPASMAGTEAVSELEIYRHCVLSFLNNLDRSDSPDGRIAALKLLAKDANEKTELDNLSIELASLLTQNVATRPDAGQEADLSLDDVKIQPSIQELLIRLLEQLVVPVELQAKVDAMKLRLEKEVSSDNWKQLLKDVAVLINSIRSRMQKEKHEFEDFLQQITGRLNEMDSFLQIESSNLKIAEQQGREFDSKVKSNVQTIRDDMTAANDLNSLKGVVETRLDTMSQHIKAYREAEQLRSQEAQQNVDSMQERMVSMEQETESLKHIIVEKNKQAMFDVLTGIPNRLAYEKKVEEEIARWKRFGNPLSLAVWDVDLFKTVNDTYGHAAGDKVLKTIARVLHDRIRATDFFARYGGEEFVMLLPGTREEETLRLVNDLRAKVESCGFHYHGEAVKITVSCGVSCFRKGDSLEKVFERADKALYKAKQNGRNQCVIASCLSE